MVSEMIHSSYLLNKSTQLETTTSTRDNEANKSERRMPLASGDEEGRGKLRKAAGSCKQASIRRCPNGATRAVEDCTRISCESTQGTETS